MGFHEDDRIRNKNQVKSKKEKQEKQEKQEKTYTLLLDKKCDIARLVTALDMGGYKVELADDGTTIIVR